MSVQKISTYLKPTESDFIYDLLSRMRLGLCVDIGAAAGEHTLYMLNAGDANTRVVAYEPFPGNHAFFRQATEGKAARLVTNAVSDVQGTARFVVPSSVAGTEAGWESLKGYSSVGFLAHRGWKAGLKGVAKRILGRAQSGDVLEVMTTTIDSEFPGEVIDFMKIDVQGAEGNVLRGARSLLDAGQVRVLYVEWYGSPDEVSFLEDRGYALFDSTYVAGTSSADFKPFADIGFEFIKQSTLSTGNPAFHMRLSQSGPSPVEAMDAVRKARLGWIQTDFIAVSPASIEDFHGALSRYAASQAA